MVIFEVEIYLAKIIIKFCLLGQSPVEETEQHFSNNDTSNLASVSSKINLKLENINSTSTPASNIQKQQNNTQSSSGFIQIYVPKTPSNTINTNTNTINTNKSLPNLNNPSKIHLVTSNINNLVSKSPNAPVNNLPVTPAPKKTTKKRTNSASNTNKSIQLNDSASDQKAKNFKQSSSVLSSASTTAPTSSSLLESSTNQSQHPSLTTSTTPNTKIINASNFNLLRKITIDPRSMPVIVTLNSNDNDSVSTQPVQTQQPNMHQNQLKIQAQQQIQQNKQIKLLNSRITFKPAITNSNNTHNNMSGPIQNSNSMENSPAKSTTNVLNGVSMSPIKTTTLQLQLQKASPLLKQLNLNVSGSCSGNGTSSNSGTNQIISNSQNIISTSPISNYSSSSSITGHVSSAGGSSFTNSSSMPSLSILKPSKIIKKVNPNESEHQ